MERADELRERLRAIISEVSEIDEIPDRTPFRDLGIDSMMAMEIVAEVERTYKLSIPESELRTLTHFEAVYELVKRKLEEKGQLLA
ncbi:MAG: acyl carrier protein [Deltaproteobacteria bacterium]|nr:acyl carrier protein [Deltaproteobacteria bacterium]